MKARHQRDWPEIKHLYLKPLLNVLQEIVLDYIQAGMKTQYKTENAFWIPFLGGFVLGLGFVELFSYIYIFVYLYQHNQTLHILTEETKKSRNKFNLHTMMGQFYLYITDTVYVAFIMAAFTAGTNIMEAETKDLFVLVKVTEFGVLAVVHCLLIPQLRVKLFVRAQKIMEWMLYHIK